PRDRPAAEGQGLRRGNPPFEDRRTDMPDHRPANAGPSYGAADMNGTADATLSKVPEVTLTFWLIKILATTLGETGGDAVSMSLNLGYVLSSIIFIGIFVVAVIAQIAAKAFHPFLYWLVIVATTTAGTTMADFADRSLGIGYPGGASILFVLLMASLGAWY